MWNSDTGCATEIFTLCGLATATCIAFLCKSQNFVGKNIGWNIRVHWNTTTCGQVVGQVWFNTLHALLLEMCFTISMQDELFWILPDSWFVRPWICQQGRSGQSVSCWAYAGPCVVVCAVYASGGPWEHSGLKGNISLNLEFGSFQ